MGVFFFGGGGGLWEKKRRGLWGLTDIVVQAGRVGVVGGGGRRVFEKKKGWFVERLKKPNFCQLFQT